MIVFNDMPYTVHSCSYGEYRIGFQTGSFSFPILVQIKTKPNPTQPRPKHSISKCCSIL